MRTGRFLRLVDKYGVEAPKFEEVLLTKEAFPKLTFNVPALRISWANSKFFNFNQDELRTDAKLIIELVADAVTRDIGDVSLFVVGHTDAVGAAPYNEDLSLRRAQHVAEMLVTQGVPERQLSIAGVGFRQPVASNITESGRALNRRVEFMLSAFSEVNFQLVENRQVDEEFLSVPEPKIPSLPEGIPDEPDAPQVLSLVNTNPIVVFDVRRERRIRILQIPERKRIRTLPKLDKERKS